MIRDIDVRVKLRASVTDEFRDDPGSIIIDELGILDGDCRIDLAVVNGQLHGYEIKSDADTLERLPAQLAAYNSVFDRITIVTGAKHVKGVADMVPAWWGVTVATAESGNVVLRSERNASNNEQTVSAAVASLLWREELLSVLKEHNAARGLSGQPRWRLRKVLADVMSPDQLRATVRCVLKHRIDWRSDALRT